MLMKTHVLKSVRSVPLTLLRVGVGIIMAVHGAMKIWDLSTAQQQFEAIGIPLAGATAVVVAIFELAGGVALAVGLFTPIAAAAIVAVMVGAIAFVHGGNGLLAQDGGFEYPLTVGLVALFYVFRGAGPISIDAWLATRRPSTSVVLGRHPAEVSS
jgi:putative oxidoreductase